MHNLEKKFSKWIKPVQKGSNLSKIDQTCPKQATIKYIGSNLSKLNHAIPKWTNSSKTDMAYPEWTKLVQIWFKFQKLWALLLSVFLFAFLYCHFFCNASSFYNASFARCLETEKFFLSCLMNMDLQKGIFYIFFLFFTFLL